MITNPIIGTYCWRKADNLSQLFTKYLFYCSFCLFLVPSFIKDVNASTRFQNVTWCFVVPCLELVHQMRFIWHPTWIWKDAQFCWQKKLRWTSMTCRTPLMFTGRRLVWTLVNMFLTLTFQHVQDSCLYFHLNYMCLLYFCCFSYNKQPNFSFPLCCFLSSTETWMVAKFTKWWTTVSRQHHVSAHKISGLQFTILHFNKRL